MATGPDITAGCCLIYDVYLFFLGKRYFQGEKLSASSIPGNLKLILLDEKFTSSGYHVAFFVIQFGLQLFWISSLLAPPQFGAKSLMQFWF